MFRNFKKLVFQPLFIYTIIAMLECISYNVDKPVVLNEMPKIGDNFGTIGSPTVYYFSGKGKYTYPSAECFLSYGNPPFSTNYKEGGIKKINKEIADRIPLLGTMCGIKKTNIKKSKTTPSIKRFFSTNYLLDNFSNISHVLSYLILALSIAFHFKSHKNKYWLAFILCFIGGASLEFVQKYFIVGRTASFEDQFLNCVGAVLGISLFWILKKYNFFKPE
jgi:hypothetical protein